MRIAALVCAILLVVLALASGGEPRAWREPTQSGAGAQPDGSSGLTQHFTFPFEPSLEMRENVDFLLTPALLVQDAISEGVIITYPEE